MEFYERMRELRKEHGETQAQVAAAAGMTDRQYQRVETGRAARFWSQTLRILLSHAS